MKQVQQLFFVLVLAMFGSFLTTAPASASPPSRKVVVCKYSGEPGRSVPRTTIEVSVNTMPKEWSGSFPFAWSDAQGQSGGSVAIGYTDSVNEDISSCPGYQNPDGDTGGPGEPATTPIHQTRAACNLWPYGHFPVPGKIRRDGYEAVNGAGQVIKAYGPWRYVTRWTTRHQLLRHGCVTNKFPHNTGPIPWVCTTRAGSDARCLPPQPTCACDHDGHFHKVHHRHHRHHRHHDRLWRHRHHLYYKHHHSQMAAACDCACGRRLG